MTSFAPGVAIRQWGFTVLLLGAYLALFHSWHFLDRFWVGVTGVTSSVALGWAVLALGRRGYFHNRWDQFFHGVVVLDMLLEAILIGPQDGFGYYWCALGFAACIGGYRLAMYRAACAPTH